MAKKTSSYNFIVKNAMESAFVVFRDSYLRFSVKEGKLNKIRLFS
jgi:hypothetical protein